MTERQAWGSRGAAPVARRARHRTRPTGRTPTPTGAARVAFDLLHLRHATAFTRQAYLLSGHPAIAERAVAHAFRVAWERWPEVAADPDPSGRVRAVAHDYALSPRHRFAPGLRTRPPHPGPPADRALLAGLLTLPRPYRRCLLLHDGLGIDLAATAAETEASTAATHGRLVHAREALTARVPELRNARAERRTPLLTDRLGLLLASTAVRPPPPPAQIRAGSERITRRLTVAAYGLTLTVAAAVAASLATAEPWADPPPDDDAVAPAVSQSGPYLPQLRSRNERMRLVERDGRQVAVPWTGPDAQAEEEDEGEVGVTTHRR